MSYVIDRMSIFIKVVTDQSDCVQQYFEYCFTTSPYWLRNLSRRGAVVKDVEHISTHLLGNI